MGGAWTNELELAATTVEQLDAMHRSLLRLHHTVALLLIRGTKAPVPPAPEFGPVSRFEHPDRPAPPAPPPPEKPEIASAEDLTRFLNRVNA